MKKITSDVLNNLVLGLAGKLSAHGIDLDINKKYELNDALTSFLTENCGISVEEDDSSRDGVVEISFDVDVARTSQTVRILDDGHNQESIVSGLRKGSLATTMSHDELNPSYIVDLKTNSNVAEIISQEFHGDYIDFN